MFIAAAGMTAGLLGAALPASAATHGVGPVTSHTVSHQYDKNKGDKGGPGDKGHGDNGRGDNGRGDNGRGDKGHGDKGHGDKGHGDKGHGDKGHGDKGETYRLDVRYTPYREPYKLVKVHNPGDTLKPCDAKKPKHHCEAPSYRNEHKRHRDPKPRDTRKLHLL